MLIQDCKPLCKNLITGVPLERTSELPWETSRFLLSESRNRDGFPFGRNCADCQFPNSSSHVFYISGLLDSHLVIDVQHNELPTTMGCSEFDKTSDWFLFVSHCQCSFSLLFRKGAALSENLDRRASFGFFLKRRKECQSTTNTVML